jgi:hypothetical protein
MTPLAGWQNFYVIVGSSAGALIGLQFIVVTLLADMPIGHSAAQAGDAFATPTIIHFGAVLFLAGVISAPWQGIAPAAGLWGFLGLSGVVYSAIVAGRLQRQTAYQPEFEDWLFHVLLPFAGYMTLSACALVARSHGVEALYGVAGAVLLLLFTGIHNAWDAVTYHVFVQKRKQQ